METDTTASRWVRLMRIKHPLAHDHPFTVLYTQLVTVPAVEARQSRSWSPIDPEGQLDRLESCAREHDLLDDLEMVNGPKAIADIILASGLLG